MSMTALEVREVSCVLADPRLNLFSDLCSSESLCAADVAQDQATDVIELSQCLTGWLIG